MADDDIEDLDNPRRFKFAGEDYDGEVITNCQKCKSHDTIIEVDDSGYFKVVECNKCGWRENDRT